MSARVLVCGGRDYSDTAAIDATLDALHAERGIDCVLEGGATGADARAAEWALDRGIPCVTYVADWKLHGRAAGPIRNQHMLDDGKPDLVVAFPGGKGTADMVRRARKAGVEVLVFEPAASSPALIQPARVGGTVET